MHISHVTLRAEIIIETLRTLPSDANYPMPLATVADDIGMLDASSRIIEYQEIVSTLVADPIVAPSAMIPLNDDRLVWRSVGRIWTGSRVSCGGRPTDLHYRPSMTLTAILVVPFPVLAADDSQANL